ncbi:FtsX-like permease family protein [Oceanibaculum nanhaiense]|uniref:FtsX-like permease family protein n=1 Tax=Oceanibaculum nanhaiense TaxID=1909734 RepID=UPI003D2BAFAD
MRIATAFSTRLAIRQLRHIGLRLFGTFSGICVAIVLVFAQAGFMNALVGSALNLPRALQADLFITGPQFETMAYSPPWFARSLMDKALAVPGVADARPFYAIISQARNPYDGTAMSARFIAFDPSRPVLDLPEVTQALPYLKLPDAALLDSRSRRKFIPIIERLENGGEQRLYLQSPGATLAPEMRVIGLYGLGPDFTIDGSFIFSDLNYYRLFQLPLDRLSLGLLTIEPGADLQKVRDAVAAALGDRAKVFTHAEFVAGERDYFLFQTPIGIILGFGLAVGVFIGIVFVMQALYSIIDMNISEYAVLRAMGYRDMFFIALVLQIAVLIGVGAFIPSIGITALIYELVGDATRLRFTLSLDIVGTVFLATIVMGSVAVLFAVRKLRRNNPLDLFG